MICQHSQLLSHKPNTILLDKTRCLLVFISSPAFLLGGTIFKYYSDQIIRRCISDEEVKSILSFCHELACGEHFGPGKTAEKVLQSGFYWSTLFKDTFKFCKTCLRCQVIGRISKHNMLPLHSILKLKLFDI